MNEELNGLKATNTSFEVNGEIFEYPEVIQILKDGKNLKKLLNNHPLVWSNGSSFSIGKPGNIVITGIMYEEDEKIIKKLLMSKNADLEKFVETSKKIIGEKTNYYGKFITITKEHRNFLVSILHFMKNKDMVDNPIYNNVNAIKDQTTQLLNAA